LNPILVFSVALFLFGLVYYIASLIYPLIREALLNSSKHLSLWIRRRREKKREGARKFSDLSNPLDA